MRLPTARRAAVRLGSIVLALLAAGALTVTSGTSAPAAATGTPSWDVSLSASVKSPDVLSSQSVGDSPSGSAAPSPSTNASPAPTAPTESARPKRSDEPRDSGPGTVDLSVALAGPSVDVGSGGRSMRIDVSNTGSAPASDVVVTIDATALADAVTVSLPSEGCTTAAKSQGKKVTCAYAGGVLTAGAVDSSLTFFLMPQPDTKPAPGGAVTVKVDSGSPDADPADNTTTAQIRVVESAVNLVAQVSDATRLAPGQIVPLVFVVANRGTEPAHGMSLEFTLPAYVSFVDDYQNCTYTADRRRMVCDFATVTLAQDQALTAEDFDPIRIQVASDAPGPATLGRGSLTVTALGETDPLVERGAGPMLRTIASQPREMAAVWPRDADTTGHTASFALAVTANPADLTVAPGRVSGAEGDVVRVPITVTNNGPADAVGGFTATVDAPTGTEIVGVPPECQQLIAGRRYVCVVPQQIEVGAAQVGQLNIRITSKTVGDDGAVTVSRPSGVAGADNRPENNRARLTVTVNGSGGGGGSDWLPVTGNQASMMALGGAALLAAGVVLYAVGRRRRSADQLADGMAAPGQVAENPPSTQIS